MLQTRGGHQVGVRLVAGDGHLVPGLPQPYAQPRVRGHVTPLAFLARSVVAEPLAALLRAGLPIVLDFYAGQLRAAQAAGQVAADVDAVMEAAMLFAFAQGLVNPIVIGHYTAEDAAALVEHQLGRLFGRPQAPSGGA
ncbi:TetR family transcriptional regulator C-terminal domain-containing protein [Nonomuraea sp. NPDC051191]|uniref:TetR family transcriptional regulator C-terminal domain-containing protein n=1 Tax=Nonomuraea sp. NPDC051191 TaxID=3364372 RepID=UPI0037AA63E8